MLGSDPNISFRFSADGIPQVARALEGLRTGLDGVGESAEDAASALSQMAPSMNRVAQSMDRFKDGFRADPTGRASLLNMSNDLGKVDRAARAAANGVKTFGQATSAGSGLVTDFSRIIQDLPFGFLGIANNLQQLPGSFQRLSAAAKESGKSMGSLILSSISGFGGIGLALSLVTGGLLIAQNGIAGFGRASKKAQEDADELAKTIRSIADIQSEAIGGVQGTIAQVNSLSAAISDGNLPYEQRKRALEELKSINKAYFGDLQLEDAATGKLTKTIEEYNKAIIAQALVKSFANEIAEVSKAAIKANSDLEKATTKLRQSEKALELARATGRPTGREGTGQSREEVRANDELIEAFKAQREQREKVLALETQEAVLKDQLNKATLQAIQFKDTENKGSEREVDLLSKRLRALEKIKEATKDLSAVASLQEQIFDLQVKITLRDAAKNGLSKEEVDLAIKGFKDELNDAFQKEALSLEAIPKVKVQRIEIVPLESGKIESAIAKATGVDKTIPIESDRDARIRLQGLQFVLDKEKIEKATKDLKDTLFNSTAGALGDTADLFGNLLGDVFSGEGVGNAIAKAAQGLLGIIGNVLQTVGRQIIATSALVEALKKAIDNLFGPGGTALGFAVGAALVALGGLMKSFKFPGLASGITNFGGGFALVGEVGPELVRLPQGSDVIPNHMIGGMGERETTTIAHRISGNDLLVIIERATKSKSRGVS